MKRPARGDNPLFAIMRETSVFRHFLNFARSQLAASSVNESRTCASDWHKSDTALFEECSWRGAKNG